ncbi:MAG: DUF3341 domain-containing protein [Bryobacterales bacterium]|nr:DUF3341 domain-containing protein [Bryobacterales bacterium]
MAEFETPEQLLTATERTHREGYRQIDAYSPLPVEGLAEAMGIHHNAMPAIVFVGGLLGALGGYGLQYWVSVMAYPLNIGGKPLHSWVAFIPVTFEMMVLSASIFAVVGMLALNGLPQPYHPVFNAPRFVLATNNRFFLCIEAGDPLFDPDETRQFLQSLSPRGIEEVEK